MHFGLTQEQELLQESLRRFTSESLPAARRRALFDAGRGFDEALWQGAAKLGICGLAVPVELGGAGLELLDEALVFEVLGEAAVPGPFLAHALVCHAILRAGSAEQKRRWLPRLAAGEVIGGVALCEALDSAVEGWDPASWRLEVERGRASGRKIHVHAGPECGLLLVGTRGGGLGLVETSDAGVRLTATDGLDRTRGLADLVLASAAIDGLGTVPAATAAILDAGRILLAADAFGAAWRLIRMSVDYAMTREQFETPIAQFQAVKHQLANMAMEAEPMRGLLWYAAWAFDHRPEEAPREAATVKAHVGDRAVEIGRAAVSIHGGIGFTWECDVHFWLKRAIFDRIWLGSPAAHRERLAVLAGY